MFDVGLGEMLVLVVLALVIFGDRLPQVVGQAGRMLRQLRTMANSAKEDLRDGLGPEFADLDLADLHPKTFVRKHLLDDDPVTVPDHVAAAPFGDDEMAVGERPPFDREAT